MNREYFSGILSLGFLVLSLMSSPVLAEPDGVMNTAKKSVENVTASAVVETQDSVAVEPVVVEQKVEAVFGEAEQPAVESTAAVAVDPVVSVVEQKVEAVVEKTEPVMAQVVPSVEKQEVSQVIPPPVSAKPVKVKMPVKPVNPVSLPEQATMQNDWINAMKNASAPTIQHKMLEPLAGNWEYTMRLWRSPDSEPEVSTGTTEAKWIEGGAFLEQVINGKSLGQPFQGRDVTGYDSGKNSYVGFRFYDLATATMISEAGRYDADSKVLEQTGTSGAMSFRWVTRITDQDHHVFQVFMTDAVYGEYLGMDIVFQRKAEPKVNKL